MIELAKYIFNDCKYEYKFEYNKLQQIQDNLKTGITFEDAQYFLRWVVEMIKLNLNTDDVTLTCCCGEASSLAKQILESFNLEYFVFNLKNILRDIRNVHSITLVKLKIVENSNITLTSFVIDPTFKQFCVIDRCLKDKTIKYSGGEYKVPPYPGYFLSLTKEGNMFGTDLLNKGFFALNENNFKLYCDSFQMYKNASYSYHYTHNIRSGKEYIGEIYNCGEKDINPKRVNLKLKV